MSSRIRVLIADDLVIAREGIQRILERERDIEIAGVVRTAPEVLPAVRGKKPDVVLLDLKWHADECAMIDVIARLRRTFPRTSIVALTEYPDLIQKARSAGAAWAATKNIGKDELVSIIRAVRASPIEPVAGDPAQGADAGTGRAEPAPTIGIVTALPKEYVAVKGVLERQRERTMSGQGAGRRYLIGEVPASNGGNHTMVLSLADMGNNVAAARATLLLEHWPTVRSILMVGIAGGVPYPEKPDEHVRLGDVVVSGQKGVVQYDFDKETIREVIHRYPPRPPGAALLEAVRLLEAGEIEGHRPWVHFVERLGEQLDVIRPPETTDILADSDDPRRTIDHPSDPGRVKGQPRVFSGAIASANKLLRNPVRRDALRDRFGVKAVEMEGSGIADATWYHEVGYLVVRGICDYCDANKGDDWQAYAAVVAAAYVRALLESMPGRASERPPKDIPSIPGGDVQQMGRSEQNRVSTAPIQPQQDGFISAASTQQGGKDMPETIRILIADDTDIAREGLTRILATARDMEIVGEGATLHATVRKVYELRPNVLILDLKWFDDERAGIEAIERLARDVPETKVIAITIYPHLVQEARKAGAVAALNKEISKEQLIEEIRSVHAVPPAAPSGQEGDALPAYPVEELTAREHEVLSLLAEGMTDRQIADTLSIAESTAKNHVSSILGKLGVPNRAGAVSAGYKLGLIGTEPS